MANVFIRRGCALTFIVGFIVGLIGENLGIKILVNYTGEGLAENIQLLSTKLFYVGVFAFAVAALGVYFAKNKPQYCWGAIFGVLTGSSYHFLFSKLLRAFL